jgi:hypothetical protein
MFVFIFIDSIADPEKSMTFRFQEKAQSDTPQKVTGRVH